MDRCGPTVSSHPPAVCSTGLHLAGSRRPQQAAMAPMESACGYGNTDACQWVGAFRSANCVSQGHMAFWGSHDHLRDNHGVVVTEFANRQNRYTRRVEARRRRCRGNLCELLHRAIHATVLFHMNTEEVFKTVFWTLLVSMFLMRFWFAFRVWRAGERLGSDRAARQRMGFWASLTDQLFFLLLVAVVVHLYFRGGNLHRFAFPAPDWLRWAGCALGMMSVGLFAWAHASLGRFWSPHLQLRPSHQLITVGPYARIRHPIYSAILGWLMSLGLVAANWTPFMFAALGALHLLLKIQGEEIMMLEQFGD